jgi:hypothetical protein
MLSEMNRGIERSKLVNALLPSLTPTSAPIFPSWRDFMKEMSLSNAFHIIHSRSHLGNQNPLINLINSMLIHLDSLT